jgi:hypothetical protein
MGLRKAIRALRDSRCWDIRIADEKAATHYSTLLRRQVAAGDLVRLDGAWSDDLKRHLLSQFRSLVVWINERADRQLIEEAEAEVEEEEGKDANSPPS